MHLSIDALTVASPRGRALAHIPVLEVATGTALGIAGPSGAGKSTLLFALAGLLPQATGRVIWGGTDILALPRAKRHAFAAKSFGIVFQDFLLFDELGAGANASVAAMYAPKTDRTRLRDAATAQLTALGLTELDRPVASFSGGERQRVAVARALAPNPPVLLADEPTASLDRDAADRLIADLTQAARDGGRTLICVSHDPALLSAMDRVIHMADGRLQDA